jgi:hypothetical protein
MLMLEFKMRRYILHIILLIGFVGFSQNQPKVLAKADTTKIRIGERISYEIVVDNADKGVVFSELKLDSLGRVELVESLGIDTLKNQLIKKYALTSFDSGSYVIPRQRILIWSQEYLTDSLRINVSTVAVDTTKQQMYTIKAIQNEPYTIEDFKNYLWWILGILLILGLILYVVLRRKKDVDENGEPIIAPYQEAIRNLRQLDKKQLWQNNRVKEYYSELTGIVRYYIERELKIPALERTTDGLIDTLADFSDADAIVTTKETIDKLKDLLQEADLVKFAKSKPLANEIENDRLDAEEIINKLQPTAVMNTMPDVESETPIILVQKPAQKNPSVLGKVFIILGLLLIGAIIIYGISIAAKKVQNINKGVDQEQNSLNQSTNHVE